jgi:hypothetical protein
MKPHLAGYSFATACRLTTGGRLQQLFFGADCKLFVPSAQKDARLENARLGRGANQGATDDLNLRE